MGGKTKKEKLRNNVARHMEEFNRPVTHQDRKAKLKRGYRKHAKDWRDHLIIITCSRLSHLGLA